MLTALLIAAVIATAPQKDVRDAEIAFAKAFADRDQDRFFRFVLDDATFLGGMRTLSGKAQVVNRWSKFFESKDAPFSWMPERVVTNAAGTTALSSGPVFDAAGEHAGNYASVWLKQSDGSWKVLFDGPGSAPACITSIDEGDIALPDGAKLHYRKVGDGAVKVIVPLDFIMFDFVKSLADVATVISYDVRNRGRSSSVANTESLTVQQDVRDLESIRQHFNVDRFVPIGFSYLGLMVVMYALDHPEHVDRIVQLGPVPRRFGTQYPKELANTMDDVAASEADVKRWRELKANGATPQRELCEAQDRVFRYVLVGDPTHVSRIKGHCDLPNEWPANLDRHFDRSMESMKSVAISDAELKKLTVPVLTIHGTKDRNAPYGSGREWAAILPNARLVTIEGAAHASWADDPAMVFAAIRSFLRGDWPLTASEPAR